MCVYGYLSIQGISLSLFVQYPQITPFKPFFLFLFFLSLFIHITLLPFSLFFFFNKHLLLLLLLPPHFLFFNIHIHILKSLCYFNKTTCLVRFLLIDFICKPIIVVKSNKNQILLLIRGYGMTLILYEYFFFFFRDVFFFFPMEVKRF